LKQLVRHLLVMVLVAMLVMAVAATSCHVPPSMATPVLVGSNN